MGKNADFIRNLYDAFSRGDLDGLLQNCDPSIEWISTGDPKVVPWGGRRTGVAGAASFFHALADNLNFEVFQPRDFYEDGDTVVVVGRTRAQVKRRADGLIDCEWVHVCLVNHGKLKRFQEFYDTAAIEKALAA
jgi:ketosteroid isomerase-like protein